MANKNIGFTLIELMAVIVIISLIAILTFPSIVNQIKKSEKNNSNNINSIVISAAKKYVNDNPNEFKEKEYSNYCIAISDLVDNDYLKEDIVSREKDYLIDEKVNIIYTNAFKYDITDKCSILPKGYIQISYLEGIGGQYINTGVKPDVDLVVKLGITPETVSSGSFISASLGENNEFRLLNAENYLLYDLIDSRKNYSPFNLGNYYDMVIGNYYLDVNGNKVSYEEKEEIAIDKNISLFNDADCKIYYSKFYLKNKLIRYFVPAQRKEDNELGLYDLVTDKFYVNEGKGNFISEGYVYTEHKKYIDEEQSISNYSALEYLEGTGKQEIDTGVLPFKNLKLKIGIVPKSFTGGAYIGASNGIDTNDFRLFSTGGSILYDFGSSRLIGGSIELGSYYDMELGNNYVISNDEKILTGTERNTVYMKFPIKLFLAPSQIYYLKIYDGEKLIRDYVPVKRNSDGELGLYDKVENSFYQNSGTGEFLYE